MKIVIVEDHPLMRSALMSVVAHVLPNTQIEAFSKLHATKRWLQHNPDCDLIIMDLELPDCERGDGLTLLQQQAPKARVVVISAMENPLIMQQALFHGAAGYIPKSAGLNVVQQALIEVISGRRYVPDAVLALEQNSAQFAFDGDIIATRKDRQSHGAFNEALNEAVEAQRKQFTAQLTQAAKKLCLTDRQTDVLCLILRGLPNKLICRHLSLAEGTVKVHVSAVLRALGARNRTEVVIAASQMGLDAEQLRLCAGPSR